jgi:hypothetical protein
MKKVNKSEKYKNLSEKEKSFKIKELYEKTREEIVDDIANNRN